jgi:hypothetical protein
MRLIILSAIGLASLAAASCTTHEERVGGAATGVAAGAVVAGPVGAVAGGVIGATTGPAVSRTVGVRHASTRHTHRVVHTKRKIVRKTTKHTTRTTTTY